MKELWAKFRAWPLWAQITVGVVLIAVIATIGAEGESNDDAEPAAAEEVPVAEPEEEAEEPEPEQPDRRARLLDRVGRICPEDRTGLENMVEFAREAVRDDFGVNVSDVDVLLALDEALKGQEARDQVRGNDSCAPVLAPLIVFLGEEV